MKKRKDAQGNKVDWSEHGALPRLVTTGTAYLDVEDDFLDEFKEALAHNKVDLGKGRKHGTT
jgi:hypothetical protein